ncbi:MAG: HAMP domain-containing histidine kinase [Mogibacterium sp.]|nr:HAMP domain-containing histidine kinase [Mogibacterium sp.]
MIKVLKRRFIVLAMVSLTVLLAVIVAGMNIINYEKVVSDADARLEVLQQNSAQLLRRDPVRVYSGDPDDDFDDDDLMAAPFGDDDFDDDMDEFYFGRRGPGGPSMSRDEAEESRFFTVSVDENGNVSGSDVGRISAVDSSEAEDYAKKALASGKDNGFVDDFRYVVSDKDDSKIITFLDCGRVLDSFRDFLKYSVAMSLLGLAVMFAVITYFAGRIVKPVAESYDKQKRFITDAGHEIKTPLAIIKANIDVLNMDIDSGVDGSISGADPASAVVISEKAADELRDSLGDINDQVDRLTGLTNDLVYLSRMEEAGSTLVMTEVPFSDTVSETVSSFEPLAREKGKEFSSEIDKTVFVKGSVKELEKLVSIIMENAVKYSPDPESPELNGTGDGMPAPPVIDVRLRKDGRNAVFEVGNRTENELTDEALAHVFDRFYRTDSSRNSETGGHGIGLSTAQAIVAAHGGKISARTTDGHDFIITASIPLA